jgi:hypothetical protein
MNRGREEGEGERWRFRCNSFFLFFFGREVGRELSMEEKQDLDNFFTKSNTAGA